MSNIPDSNPYQSPVTDTSTANAESKKHAKKIAKLEKKARNIGNDAEKAILVGLIPILGLIFIFRLVQWYTLRPDIEGNQAIDRHIRRKFLNGKTRLWIAVLLWPVLLLFIVGYTALT